MEQPPLSTENGLSPLQLYTAYAQGSPLFEDQVDPDSCGTDSLDDHTSTADTDDQTDMVIVPIVDIPLSLTSIQRLSSTIDPL